MPWGAAIAIGGAYLTSEAQGDAADQAASAQGDATSKQIEAQRQELAEARRILQPYVTAGNNSIEAQGDLIGLNGPEKQKTAYAAIQGSPGFATLAKQGEDALLANASATGGLRGGNLQAGLAQFRPQLLNQMIQQQFGNLGSLTGIGASAAGANITAGANATNQISAAYGQQGAVTAGNALAQGQAKADLWNGIAKAGGTVAGYYGGF